MKSVEFAGCSDESRENSQDLANYSAISVGNRQIHRSSMGSRLLDLRPDYWRSGMHIFREKRK